MLSSLYRNKGMLELQEELKNFSHDGLIQLKEDLQRGRVIRGSWSGCVISYRRGGAGSSRRDHKGRARNDFTIAWDNGWITEEEVISAVDCELAIRRLNSDQNTSLPVSASILVDTDR